MDVIEFSMFNQGNDQCDNRSSGTYIVQVPHFVDALVSQEESDAYDLGEDYEHPASYSSYSQCTQIEIGDENYWLQLGCSDSSSKSLAVNIYSDGTCETKVTVEDWDDSNIDVSDLEIPFKECQSCVKWPDINDDQIDDQYYQNKQANAPLCSSLWTYKQECDRSCQKFGRNQFQKPGWNTSDKVLLSIMSAFGTAMLIGIIKRRRSMSKKELLLEEAAMSAAGLQQSHIIGIFFLAVMVIIVFALLGLKNITWALLLVTNTVLFTYLMKLTVDNGMNSASCGGDLIDATSIPDGRFLPPRHTIT